MTNSNYLKLFHATVNTIESVRGTMGQHANMIEEEITKLGNTYHNSDDKNKRTMYIGAVKAAKDRYLTVTYMMGSDHHRYGALLEDMKNNCVCGKNEWPTKLIGAHHLLTTWKNDRRYT